MKRLFKHTLVATICAVFVSGVGAVAGPKPKNSTPADPTVIHKMYNGNTWIWSEGGSYWGKKGVFQATFKGRAYGDGKWYVTNKGTLCYEALWKSTRSKTKAGEEIKNCWRHVVDADGQIWQRNHEKEDWYKLSNEKLERGNKIKAEHRKIKKTVGF